MRLVLFPLSSISVLCLSALAAAPDPKAATLLDAAPIRFEAVSGQTNWRARGSGYSFLFNDDAAMLRVGDRTVDLTFPGSDRRAPYRASDRFQASTNYFTGKSYSSVAAFARLHRAGIYPGIDVVYYGHGREIEYDFEIAPGADPSRIRMRFDGADAVSLNGRNEVVLTLGAGEIVQRAPVVYQKRASGEIVKIEARYRLAKDGTVRVALGKYNRADALVVDPAITYSAYLSGTQSDWATSIGHDAQGNVYMAGNTWSLDFPTSPDAEAVTSAGNEEIWVMKLNPAGGDSAIVYCTYLGGSVDDQVTDMVVDAKGVIYLTGVTLSGNFPTTPNALASVTPLGGNNHAFVTMLDPSQAGSAGLVYSTFLGGTNFEEGDGIAVANGKIYVTGLTTSDDFPTVGAYQSARVAGFDTFVVEIDPTQSGTASLIYGTYLGGSAQDLGRAIAVDAAGNIYVAGVTFSLDFPTAGNAYQTTYGGDGDAFLAELNPTNGTLVYSTYLGGQSIDEVKKIVIEPGGHVGMTGYTISPDYPVTQLAYNTAFGGNGNAFLTILDLTRQQGLVYSTFFGGSGGEVAYALRLDAAGLYYLAGYTMSPDFPVTANALNPVSMSGAVDGFIAVLDPTQPPFSPKTLVYSSYVTGPGYQIVYGLDVDSSGTIYATGLTTSTIFPNGFANPFALKQSAFVMLFSLP
jgi:hypothetical protein